MLRQSDLEPYPAPILAAMRPGTHVCPWYAPGGARMVEVVLVDRDRSRVGGIVCPNDADKIAQIRAKLEEIDQILDPHPHLELLA